MAEQYAQQLHSLLRRASGLDCAPTQVTESIKQATVQLDALYKNPQASVPALAEIALTAPEDQIRQLAAVELRKLINKQKQKVWAKQPEAFRQTFKSRLLAYFSSATTTEQSTKSINNALARVAAGIGKIELAKGQWPELLPWVWQSAAGPSAQQREVALYTLFALIDTLVDASSGKAFSQYIPQLYALLGKTLADPESLSVRVLSVRVLGRIIDYIDADDSTDQQTIEALFPSIMQVCTQSLEADDIEGIKYCFDVVDGIACADTNVLGPHLPALFQFLLQSGGNSNFSEEARLPPLNTLWFMIKAKKSKIQSLNLAKPIIEGLLPIGATQEPEDSDEDSPARLAFRIMDSLANNLPPSQVMPPLMALCQQYASSHDPHLRKSAIMSFGVTFEGCSLFIAPHMDSLWPFVDQCLTDPDIIVRQAACMALSFMCDTIPILCAKRHAQLLPMVMDLVGHASTRRNALNTLDGLLEQLGKDIKPYVPALMERLMTLMTVQEPENEIKIAVTGAIGSVAHAAKADFVPYFENCMRLFLPALHNKDTEGPQLELRSITQDTVGTLADAVGKDVFNPYFQQTMQLAFEGTTVEVATSRECSFIFFGTLARVYKQDFAQYLPTLVPILLASLLQDEKLDNAEVVAQAAGFDSRTESPAQNGAADADDGDDDIYEDLDDADLEEALLGINSAVSSEKEMACSALDEIFEACGTAFLPYVEKSIQAFMSMFEDFNDSLRKAGFETSLNFINTANKLTTPAKWEPALHPTPLQADVQALVNAIVPEILKAWDQEDERDVVNSLCDNFSAILMDVGPSLIAPNELERICKLCLDIVERKAPCQMVDDNDPDDLGVDAEASEWDANLIMSASDLISSLSIVIGPEFAPAFTAFLPALTPYLDAKRSPTERSGIMGSIAEAINGLKSGVTSQTENLYQLIMASLADPDLDVRSNAAFAIGSLVAQSETDLSSHYLGMLQLLSGLFDRTTDSQESNQACDNACGAVARLIQKNPAALPMQQVLPTFLGALPIRQDNVENTQVFDALIQLLQHNQAPGHEAAILQITAKTLQKQAEAEKDKPLTEDTHAKVLAFLKALPASELQQHGLAAFVQ